MRYRHECGTRSDDYVAAIVGGAGLMPFRSECGSWSHYVGLLFAHWPDFGCLLSMNSTLANSSCDCGCLLSHNSPLANSNSWDWGQVFANSTRANSDLGGSILAKKTLTQAPKPLELDKLADCCMTVANSALARETLANCLPLANCSTRPKALAASHDLANCLPLANCCPGQLLSWPTALANCCLAMDAVSFAFLLVETTQVGQLRMDDYATTLHRLGGGSIISAQLAYLITLLEHSLLC